MRYWELAETQKGRGRCSGGFYSGSRCWGGVIVFLEHLYRFRFKRMRTPRAWVGLFTGVVLIALAALEIFVVEYGVVPTRLIVPTLVVLDVLAGWIYLTRPREELFPSESSA